MPTMITPCGGSGGGSVGAWAYLSATNVSIPNVTFQVVPFAHFDTSDTSVFGTSDGSTQTPQNVAGNSYVLLLAAGVYIAEYGFIFTANFADQVYSSFTFQTFHGANWARPDAWHANALPAAAPITGPNYGSTSVYPVTAADLPGSGQGTLNSLSVYQASGVTKTIQALTLRIAYIPTLTTDVAVY